MLMLWFYSTQWLLHESCVRLVLSKVLLAKASACGQPRYSSPISGLFPRLHLLSGYFNSNPLAYILHDIE
jgi:hypothetical protein